MIKTLEIDFDDPHSLKIAIKKLTNRRTQVLRKKGYNEIKFNGCRWNIDNVLPIIDSMFDSDLNHLYECDNKNKNYYVYAHLNPMKKLDIHNLKHYILATRFSLLEEPFYVGKGIGNRWLDLSRNDSHRKIRSTVIKHGLDIKTIKLAENLTESEAFSLESKLIDILGLKSLHKEGLLVNLDEGLTPELRRKCYPSNPLVNKILRANGYK
ncbi:MAG: hypothetical protein P4L79_10405 [Legionella sp.]|uniref:hypothetical protein n=1 Tax=Legionella sp. TaxID=459 RepID=UPI00284D32E9|nr:hypothetical protein [Legionella sp.]